MSRSDHGKPRDRVKTDNYDCAEIGYNGPMLKHLSGYYPLINGSIYRSKWDGLDGDFESSEE